MGESMVNISIQDDLFDIPLTKISVKSYGQLIEQTQSKGGNF